MQQLIRVFPTPVHIHSAQVAAKVSMKHAIHIYHGEYAKSKIL